MRNVCGAQNDPALFHVNARMLACSFSCCLASQRQFSADVIVCSGMRGDGKRYHAGAVAVMMSSVHLVKVRKSTRVRPTATPFHKGEVRDGNNK